MRLLWALPVLCLALAPLAAADDPPKPGDSSTTTARQGAAKSGDNKKEGRLIAPDDATLLRTLEKQSAPSQPEENPLERVDRRMRDVQGRLAKSDSGDETQMLQREIADDLQRLIDEAKKGGSDSKSSKQKRQTSSKQVGKQAKPNQAAEPTEGQETARPGEVSDEQKAANARIIRAIWGHLPEKMREEMQQASQDSGLPKYRSLIELYFRAIAEQSESRR